MPEATPTPVANGSQQEPQPPEIRYWTTKGVRSPVRQLRASALILFSICLPLLSVTCLQLGMGKGWGKHGA